MTGEGKTNGRRPFRGLQVRVFLFLSLSLTLLFALFTIAFHRFIAKQIIAENVAHNRIVSDAIHLSLVQSMMTKNREAIQLSLEDIVQNPAILEVTITDPEGQVFFSSDRDLIGSFLQNKAPRFGDGWTIIPGAASGDPREIYQISPIPNRAACQECHSAAREILGRIALRVSIAETDRLLATTLYSLVAMMLAALFLLFFANFAFFRRHILKPVDTLLQRFQDAAGRFAAGDEASAPDGGTTPNDEFDRLEHGFQEMLSEIRSSHGREMKKAQEMAALQEELRYQEEITLVNSQLSRRVAELDEAHHTVKKLAGQLEEKNERLEAAVKNISSLNRVGTALSSELDIDRLVTLLINISVKGLRAEAGHIMLADEKERTLEMRAWAGMGPDFEPPGQQSIGEGVSGQVAASGKALLVSHVDGKHGITAHTRFGVERRSVLCVPIRIKERMLGTIELTNRKGEGRFNEDDLEMLRSIASQSAVAIENANLYKELEGSYFDTIRALVQAVEEKDRYTRGHSERVTTFSVKIAEKMGLTEKQIQTVRYASVLHDIGKIGIDVNILQKNGRLSEEEYEIVKRHPLIGERIVAPIAFLGETLPAIRQHHERWDGLGYPSGLKAEEISPVARLMAVADAYDAMITARPYRRPRERTAAITELQRCSGSQFDPAVVEIFVELLREDPELLKLEKKLSAVGT